MSIPIPRSGDKQIPEEFFRDMHRAAFAPIGGPGVMQFNNQTWILPPPSIGGLEVVVFKLTSALSPSQTTATANSCYWDGSVWQVNTNDTVRVADGTASIRALVNAYGWGIKDAPSGYVLIARVQEQAKSISASAVVDGSKNLTGISSPVSMDGGQVPSGTLTIETLGFTTDSGSTGTLIWNESTGKYRAVDFPCCSECECDCTA